MNEQNDKNMDLALWRYGIISPLLHRDANNLPAGEVLDLASWNSYRYHDSIVQWVQYYSAFI